MESISCENCTATIDEAHSVWEMSIRKGRCPGCGAPYDATTTEGIRERSGLTPIEEPPISSEPDVIPPSPSTPVGVSTGGAVPERRGRTFLSELLRIIGWLNLLGGALGAILVEVVAARSSNALLVGIGVVIVLQSILESALLMVAAQIAEDVRSTRIASETMADLHLRIG